MFKRFLLVFLAILLYMAFWCIPFLLAIEFLGEESMVFVVPIALVVICGLLLPFMDVVAKRIFYFRGEGVPRSEQEVRQELLWVNAADIPVVVEEEGNCIEISWKYLDATWWGVMEKQGVRESFKVIVRLDPERHTATLIDVFGSLSWRAGAQGASVRWSWFRGVYLGYSLGKMWGLRENFSPGKIYDYKFSSENLHNPVMNTLLRAGWDVRLGIF